MISKVLESLGGLAFNMKECETSIRKNTINNKEHYTLVCDFDILKVSYRINYSQDITKNTMNLVVYRIYRKKSTLLLSETSRFNSMHLLNKRYLEDFIYRDAKTILKLVRIPRELFVNLDNELTRQNDYIKLIQNYLCREYSCFMRYASTETKERDIVSNLLITSDYISGAKSYSVDITYVNNTTDIVVLKDCVNFSYTDSELTGTPVRELLPILLK